MVDTVKDIFEYIWPMIVIVVTIISLIRVFYLITIGRKNFKLYKELIHLSFIIYILSLFYIVTFQDVNYGQSNFTLFKEMFRYEIGSPLFVKNVLGNILLFIPLGFYICHYLKPKNILFPAIIIIISSTVIEFTQLKIGRVFDVDDIILNIVGGVVGYLFYKTLKHLPQFTKKTWFLNLISIIMVVAFILYLLNIYKIIKIGWLFWIILK